MLCKRLLYAWNVVQFYWWLNWNIWIICKTTINKSSCIDIMSFSNLHYVSVTYTIKYVQKLVLFVIYIIWPSFCIRLIRIPRRDILIKGLLAQHLHSISHIYRGMPSIINIGTHVSFLDRRDEVYRFTWQMLAYVRIHSVLTIEKFLYRTVFLIFIRV